MSAAQDCFIGVDLGTSGCRAVALDGRGEVLQRIAVPLPASRVNAPGRVEQDPDAWWLACVEVLGELSERLRGYYARRLALDATAATLVAADSDGDPLGPALMYDDRRAQAEADLIAHHAPADSPARGAGSSLAKALWYRRQTDPKSPVLALHQADWIAGRLTGRYPLSDWNNALKMGFDPRRAEWPGWVKALLPKGLILPRVQPPGAAIASVSEEASRATGLPPGCLICSGTTDSTAAAIAAGIEAPGDAVSVLGSTLVIKILGDRPLFDATYGIYSHRLGNSWLPGGASNTGGAVLAHYFSPGELAELSRRIDPERPSGLELYPLIRPGERFPRNAPDLPALGAPRTSNRGLWLQALLEGMTAIEAEGYARLSELGAPAPRRLFSIGGGADNPAWTRLRRMRLGLPLVPPRYRDPACGAALLAMGRKTGLMA